MGTFKYYDDTAGAWLPILRGPKGDPGDTHVPDPTAAPDGQVPVTAGGVLAFQKYGNVGSTDVDTIVVLTQAEYDLLTPDPNTLYVIEEV